MPSPIGAVDQLPSMYAGTKQVDQKISSIPDEIKAEPKPVAKFGNNKVPENGQNLNKKDDE